MSVVAQSAFDDLCDELLAFGENELFMLRELHEKMTMLARDRYGAQDHDVYSVKHLRNKLKEKFKDSIYFATHAGRNDVIGFRGLVNVILNDKHFLSQRSGGGSEAEQLVTKAAALVLAEIRETEFDRAFYPTADDISGDGFRFVPPLLQLFLKRLIVNPLKQVSFGQGIIQATKPNQCIMPIMFGLGVQIDRLGHRSLQDEVSHLGFCMSNAEIRRFKFSVMSNDEPESDHETRPSIPFTQFVADNFDHNVRTLDGLGTFHGMGVIAATVITGGSFGPAGGQIRRCSETSVSAAMQDKSVPLLQFKDSGTMRLEGYTLCPFKELQKPTVMPDIINLINVWHIGLFKADTKLRPNWPGYMQFVCGDKHVSVTEPANPGECHIEFLSLVDRNPADYDCIYSTLLYVSDQARSLGLPSTCITFDQPLYIKAVDVTFKAQLDVVVRLGGFHTLMSFMGSLGHIMRGSGIEEVLLLLYGENTLEHVLSGKAYARAIRAHFLIQSALVQLLIQYLASPADKYTAGNVIVGDMTEDSLAGSVTDTCLSEIESLYEQTITSGFVEYTECDSLAVFSQHLERIKCMLREQCRTARLWITYIEYVDVLRKFLIAERTGNWLLHLNAMQCMLPLFSVTGHMNYARSARVYLQQMRNLPQTNPWLFEQFMQGNHVIRRSNRFWAGLSPDLCIEQTLMRSGKSQGGLTHGRGMTDTVRTTWLSTLTQCSAVHAAMVNVTDTDKCTGEHVEVTSVRMKRDMEDLHKVLEYLRTYSPFRMNDNSRLISLATGVAASVTDNVNCDIAQDLGYTSQQRWDGKRYGDIKLTKADKTKTMSVLTNKSADSTVRVNIDPHSLFHRLILVAERLQSIKVCFEYELTPYPMSLFKDSAMRKPDKPSLCRDFIKDLSDEALPPNAQYVIDGGYMIHKVRWNPPTDMQTMLSLFGSYLRRFGSDVVVVFDGYEHGPSIKDQEHQRRSAMSSAIAPCRNLTAETTRIGPQEPFLANRTNKMAFIKLLKDCLEQTGVTATQAEGDADTEIVSVAVQLATDNTRPVVVVAEDTDVLVLLLHHCRAGMSEMYFYSESKSTTGRKTVPGKRVKVSAVQHKISSEACDRLPAVHAFGGCDSTSAIFGHGKGTLFKQSGRSPELHCHCITLQSPTATVEDVKSAGLKLFLAVCGGNADDSLADLRYSAYCSMTLSARFRPESLPPSESAAAMHILRVHYQSVVWATLGKTSLKPTDWGWKVQSEVMVPVQLEGEVAPYSLLKVIKCNCTTQCTRASCSCRTYGLHCLSACKPCRGTTCTNRGIEPSEMFESKDSTEQLNLDSIPEFFADDELYFFDEEVV